MPQSKITEAFQPKKRIAHQPKRVKTPNVKAEPEVHPALPSRPKTAKEAELDMLRQFDLNHEFGPCIGLTRLERWQRAKKHDLNPPQRVKDVVTSHVADTQYTESVWFSYNI